MPSIVISSDAPSTARQIAEQVAARLGYDYVGHEFLTEVARRYSVPEEALARALTARGARLGILNRTRDLHLAYIRATVTERYAAGRVVCDGLSAHLYVRGIPHVLSVRILVGSEQQAAQLAAQEGIAPARAARQLEREAQRRQRWAQEVFGVDEADPANYDMVISLGQIEPARLITTVCDTVGDRRFQETTYSRKCLADCALADRVRVALIQRFPAVEVGARDGTVALGLGRSATNWRKRALEARQLADAVDGVEHIEVHRGSLPQALARAAGG